MNWQKFKCAVGAHQWVADASKTFPGLVSTFECAHCGVVDTAMVNTSWMPLPAKRPAPAMPQCKPPQGDGYWRERAEVIELLDAIERLTDRVEALEVKCKNTVSHCHDDTNVNPFPACARLATSSSATAAAIAQSS
jgi:hypothetical protein